MNKFLFVVVSTLFVPVAFATNVPELAKVKKCTSCHATDKKLVGPSWLDISKRYQGMAEAPLFLVPKIKAGGFGVWSPVRMPEQNVTTQEAKALVEFILKLNDGTTMVSSSRNQSAQNRN